MEGLRIYSLNAFDPGTEYLSIRAPPPFTMTFQGHPTQWWAFDSPRVPQFRP